MRGIVIWSQSACRSVTGLYKAVRDIAKVPVKITLYYCDHRIENLRRSVGLRDDEFADVEMIPIGDDYGAGRRFLDSVRGYFHVFTIWQQAPVYRKLMKEIVRRGDKYGVSCEAPCNMKHGIRAWLQDMYYMTLLPIKGRTVIRDAEFFINDSGEDDHLALKIGWPKNKIIPFGYYPPPLEGSHCVERTGSGAFTILSTGVLSVHRGADVFVKALRQLSDRGLQYKAIITQDGELFSKLKRDSKGLPVEFRGRLPMSELLGLYQTCSVFVGAGRHEPWGMRLNDALNCGAPLIVSRGMGGVKLVDDYGCGLAFENENHVDLANKIQMMMENRDLYLRCARNAVKATEQITPLAQAKRFVEVCYEVDNSRGGDA